MGRVSHKIKIDMRYLPHLPRKRLVIDLPHLPGKRLVKDLTHLPGKCYA